MTSMTAERRPLRSKITAGAVIVAMIFALAAIPPSGRADTAEDALDKYREPVDKAIDKALAFLAKNQNKEGVFRSGLGNNTAVTSLAVMAFLAKGYTPGTGPYGDVIDRGIDAVLSTQDAKGMLVGQPTHGPMYSHCITTLMLSEVSGMVDPERQKRIDEALPKALKIILDAQRIKKNGKHQGGWRYQYNSSDSDISCSGWALMSLRSARNAGAAVPKEGIDEAVKFIMACNTPDGGFAYQPGGGPGLARTGTGLLCLELCGKHGDKATLKAGEWILKHLPSNYGESYFYYGLYYCSQGMFQLGGDYWPRYAMHMYEMMLKFQQPDGSWPQGSSHEGKAGPCYSTAIGVLAMSVTYRQLPIYQR